MLHSVPELHSWFAHWLLHLQPPLHPVDQNSDPSMLHGGSQQAVACSNTAEV